MELDRRGRVLVLNGGSSSGKTSLARMLQADLAGSWMLVGIDLFLWTLPSRLFLDPAGLSVDAGVITRGEEYMRLYDAFRRAAAALATSGADVLVDDVLLDGHADQERWKAALRDLDVCWVGVRCGADIAEQRESTRGDRIPGAARIQADAVHRGVAYDLEVDTGALDAARAAHVVAQQLRDRWRDVGRSTAEVPYSYPLTTAWTVEGSVRAAPWEQRPSPDQP